MATTTRSVAASPSPLDVARALAPRIRARAAEIEAARELPKDLLAELVEARLFKVALPENEGGLGADVVTSLRVIEEVARADGSTGWCVAMGINTFRQSAQLAPGMGTTASTGIPWRAAAAAASGAASGSGYRVSSAERAASRAARLGPSGLSEALRSIGSRETPPWVAAGAGWRFTPTWATMGTRAGRGPYCRLPMGHSAGPSPFRRTLHAGAEPGP